MDKPANLALWLGMAHARWPKALAALIVIGLSAVAIAGDDDSAQHYLSGTVAYQAAASGGDTRIDLGSRVAVPAQAQLGRGGAASLAVGREFLSRREDGDTRHFRIEAEWWAGRIIRDSITLGGQPRQTDDRFDARAWLVNGLYRAYGRGPHEVWVGGGLGWGEVRIPAVPDAVDGCNCLQQGRVRGLALRLKLQLRRTLSAQSAMFVEIGHLQLPGGRVGKAPSNHQERLDVLTAGAGYEWRF